MLWHLRNQNLHTSQGLSTGYDSCILHSFVIEMPTNNGVIVVYVAAELSQPADFEARRRLHSASSPSLTVRCTWLWTVGDWAFPVATARVGNTGTVCHSMSRLQHHCLFSAAAWRHTPLGTATLDCTHHSYCCAWEVILSLSDTLIILVTYLHSYCVHWWHPYVHLVLLCIYVTWWLLLYSPVNEATDILQMVEFGQVS